MFQYLLWTARNHWEFLDDIALKSHPTLPFVNSELCSVGNVCLGFFFGFSWISWNWFTEHLISMDSFIPPLPHPSHPNLEATKNILSMEDVSNIFDLVFPLQPFQYQELIDIVTWAILILHILTKPKKTKYCKMSFRKLYVKYSPPLHPSAIGIMDSPAFRVNISKEMGVDEAEPETGQRLVSQRSLRVMFTHNFSPPKKAANCCEQTLLFLWKVIYILKDLHCDFTDSIIHN